MNGTHPYFLKTGSEAVQPRALWDRVCATGTQPCPEVCFY